MDILSTVQTMRKWRRSIPRDETVAFVPTMGYLHSGHMSLVDIAKRNADHVVVSIFVNPTQFGPNEDLTTYPRDFAHDEHLCRERQVTAIFYPTSDEMYGSGSSVFVDESTLSKSLCGASRPAHFCGVLTVVSKLFNIVQPDCAVFGQKDAQQLRCIQQLVADLNFPIEILHGPIVREQDGLAMSSRNVYLTDEQRGQAPALNHALTQAESLYKDGNNDAAQLRQHIKRMIETDAPLAKVDYIKSVDWNTFAETDVINGPVLIALAACFGSTRLIDNILLG
ncbi:MAG: pantoate--beta-alanine ligase [Spartobacteria bacterium]|nr:pantoate--beta-alanine ligase [Spartobacteria bacterium]